MTSNIYLVINYLEFWKVEATKTVQNYIKIKLFQTLRVGWVLLYLHSICQMEPKEATQKGPRSSVMCYNITMANLQDRESRQIVMSKNINSPILKQFWGSLLQKHGHREC